MARPRLATPRIKKNLCLPEPLVNRIDLLLYSPLEGKVPHGAWQRFIVEAIQEKLEVLNAAKQ